MFRAQHLLSEQIRILFYEDQTHIIKLKKRCTFTLLSKHNSVNKFLLNDYLFNADTGAMNNQTPATRVSVRLSCEFPAEITFSGGGSNICKKATITNISTTGIQILCPSFVATGQKVQAAFKIPGQRSKTIFNAEIMRIESLQGRMVGHYPYALGAKFVVSEEKQIKKVARFISNKMTCASGRAIITTLFFILGLTQAGRVLLHTAFTSSDLSRLDLTGLPHFMAVNGIIYPLLSGVLALGLLSSSLLSAMNKKTFMHWGFFWAVIQLLSSAAMLFAKSNSIAGDFDAVALFCGELLTLGVGIGVIAIILNVRKKFKEIEKLLSADRPSSGANRPTFTIL